MLEGVPARNNVLRDQSEVQYCASTLQSPVSWPLHVRTPHADVQTPVEGTPASRAQNGWELTQDR